MAREADGLVVCLPPSGTGRSFFARWPRHLADANVLPLSRPGHEERMREPLAGSLGAAAGDVAARVLARQPARVVLFGHSLGATVAFEAARLLDGQGPAVALVVSARQAPHLRGHADALKGADDAHLLATVLAWDGRSVAGLDDSVTSLLGPLLRADLRLSAAYQWDGGRIGAPVVAISYLDDRVVDGEQVDAWKAVASGRYRHLRHPGGHFAAKAAPDSLIAIVREELDGLGRPQP